MKDENKNDPDIRIMIGRLEGIISEMNKRMDSIEMKISKLEEEIIKIKTDNQKWYKIVTAALMIIGAILGVNLSGVM